MVTMKKKKEMINSGKDMDRKELLDTLDGTINYISTMEISMDNLKN